MARTKSKRDVGKKKETESPKPSTTKAPQKQIDKNEKKKKAENKKKSSQNFKIYIFKVLRQVCDKMQISPAAMTIMNDFLFDMFERIAREAGNLVHISRKPTMMASDVQTATKLILTGELQKYAVAEGMKSLQTYLDNKPKK